MPSSQEQVDLDQVIEEIKKRVDERRRAGQYPPGMEAQLERHFADILRQLHKQEPDLGRVRTTLQNLGERGDFSPARIETTSRLPGGSLVHVAVGKVASRQTIGILQQVQEFASVTREAMYQILDLIEQEIDAQRRGVRETLAAVQDRLAVVDQLAVSVQDIERRLAQLEGPQPPLS